MEAEMTIGVTALSVLSNITQNINASWPVSNAMQPGSVSHQLNVTPYHVTEVGSISASASGSASSSSYGSVSGSVAGVNSGAVPLIPTLLSGTTPDVPAHTDNSGLIYVVIFFVVYLALSLLMIFLHVRKRIGRDSQRYFREYMVNRGDAMERKRLLDTGNIKRMRGVVNGQQIDQLPVEIV